METIIFVNGLDGLGGKHLTIIEVMGGRAFANKIKTARRAGYLTIFFKSPGFAWRFARGNARG